MTCSICKEANHNKRGCPKNLNPKTKVKAPPEFAESQQSSIVNPKKRNRGDSGTSSKGKRARSGYKKSRVVGHGVFISQSGYTSVNQGLPSSRTVKTPSATVINSAHVTGDIGYQPTKGLKWKGKTAITQRQL
ncbi:uncharacterized protein [Nicotiana tomentosiformis]|uniref:uncharacterized protein n=1 Tax=Nicotiana tomentosiformis TaxID=4098 RepID=UPI001448530B|nr:uncharacterized protein LOC108943437 [Nicotiana tomentosiformis]